MGYIYAHINKINNKKYIGQAKNTEDRWKYNGIKYKTCPRFWSAIQHYGWDNFQHIILEETDNLNEREKYWISYYDTTNPEKGYNLTLVVQEEIFFQLYLRKNKINGEKNVVRLMNKEGKNGIKN